jgi:hypothetical protein
VTGDTKGFVPLKSLKQRDTEPLSPLAELRRIYFKTTKQTIENDLMHAIELFKQLPEEEQEKGAVYMEGIGQMRKEWERKKKGKSEKSKVKSQK